MEKQTEKQIISNRIRKVIDFYNLNNTSFARKIDIRQSTISSMFEKGTNPNIDTLLKIINTFTEISPIWLLLGTGEMIVKKEEIVGVETNSLMKIISLHEEVKALSLENKKLKEELDLLEIKFNENFRKKIG